MSPLSAPTSTEDLTVIQLNTLPSVADGYLKAIVGSVTNKTAGSSGSGGRHRAESADHVDPSKPPASVSFPAVKYVVTDVRPDITSGANYCTNIHCRLGNDVPVTYPYILSFPIMLQLMTRKDFPFGMVGAIHLANRIDQFAPIPIGASLTVSVWIDQIWKHRSGLVADVVTEVTQGEDLLWRQVCSFLKRQRTSLSNQRKQHDLSAPSIEPSTFLRVTPSEILDYADISGDRNPIHMSRLSARLFGMPGVIAHGMWTAARVLATLEGSLPSSLTYSVEFGAPLVLPGSVVVYSEPTGADAWDLSVRSAKDLKPHLKGVITPLEV